MREALVGAFGSQPVDAPAREAKEGDTVVVDPVAEGEVFQQLPHRHAFSGVRELKHVVGVAVFLIIAVDDAVGVQLARFSLADGVLLWNAQEGRLVADELTQASRGRAMPSVEGLLERLQREAGEAGEEGSLQRLLRFEREDTLLHRLQDAETGLFDGPYATLKLDEEWKRAHRFHQPLSLLLLDIGLDPAASDADRRAALADAAGVFLNECRDIDVLARFAPSVFMLLLPGTGFEGAQILAERIVRALDERLEGRTSSPSAGGLATVPSAEIGDRKSFVAVGEACLKRAQSAGAGGVCSSWQ